MSSRKPKTGFDKYIQARMKDRDFASAYKEARAEVDAVDGLMRQLDEARQRAKLSKADLAFRLGRAARAADLATLSTDVSSGRPVTTAKIQPQLVPLKQGCQLRGGHPAFARDCASRFITMI
jgi:hypothetical protein